MASPIEGMKELMACSAMHPLLHQLALMIRDNRVICLQELRLGQNDQEDICEQPLHADSDCT